MPLTRRTFSVSWCFVLLLLASAAARDAVGAVSVSLLNSGGGTSGTNVGGGTFTLTVQLSLSSSADAVTGIDYQIGASASNIFKLTARTSGTFFNDPYVSDSSISATYLDPNNGTNLGGGNQSGATLTGVGSYAVATLSFAVIQNPPPGTYKISFYLPGTDTDYSGAAPNYNTLQFATLGTYSETVPEPAMAGLLMGAGAMLMARLRPHTL